MIPPASVVAIQTGQYTTSEFSKVVSTHNVLHNKVVTDKLEMGKKSTNSMQVSSSKNHSISNGGSGRLVDKNNCKVKPVLRSMKHSKVDVTSTEDYKAIQ